MASTPLSVLDIPWPELVQQATLTRYFNAAATVILVYDFLLTFGDETQRIWKDGTWTGAKVLWFGHRYFNLINFGVLPMVLDTGTSCGLYSWLPLLETIISQFFIAAILSLRCWALFGGSRQILVVLLAVYACCLGLQVYPAVISFNQPLRDIPVDDRYMVCFLGSYFAMLDKNIGPWRIAGWIGNVVFDGVITILTFYRAIRLRESGVRITVAELMLRDGLYYFAMVLTLNVATVVTFATLPCALQLLLQRLAQVMAVVMISHMFLNLKGRDIQEHSSSTRTRRPNPFETAISLDIRVIERRKMSSTLIGNLGNDLIRISILDHQSVDEKGGEDGAQSADESKDLEDSRIYIK